jgi:hypothetical protein
MCSNVVRCAVCVWVFLFACGGCSEMRRSISDSENMNYTMYGSNGYRGELSELNVLGVPPVQNITDEEINAALQAAKAFSLKAGSRLLLVQSGARFPDEGMTEALSKSFSVVGFNGVPESQYVEKGNYGDSLRLVAAHTGAVAVVVYWGVLETGRQDLNTKAVSWLPFVGGTIPDETQLMRIRLKVAVIDVSTGSWEMIHPKSHEDVEESGEYSRYSSDQRQVAKLKALAYEATAELLKARFGK